MYNTDRVLGYDFDGPLEFSDEEFFYPKGKEWGRGYYGYRPHLFYNLGTENGRHAFDLRDLAEGLRMMLTGHWDWMFDAYRNKRT